MLFCRLFLVIIISLYFCEISGRRMLEHRIVGGETAEEHNLPFMAVLSFHKDEDDDPTLTCTGAVLNSKWVISGVFLGRF